MLKDGVKKIGSKKLEDGVKKCWIRDGVANSLFCLPAVLIIGGGPSKKMTRGRRQQRWAHTMFRHLTPVRCISPSHCQVDNNPSQKHFGATKISSYLSIKANDLRAATTKMSSHLNRMFRHLPPARCENCLISLVDNNLCLEYFQAPKLSSYLYSCPPP